MREIGKIEAGRTDMRRPLLALDGEFDGQLRLGL
jgi:hypothetical protein